MNNEMTTDNMSNEEVIEVLKGIVFNGFDRTTRKERQALHIAIKALKERPQGEYVDISKLRLMTVEECAGHTIEYAMGWKACVEWIKKGGAE